MHLGRSSALAARIAILGILLALATHTQADPDLWGHLKFGGDIAAEAAVPRVDVYAFTSDRPWVNHEWLGELAMALAYAAAGSAGLIALKLAIVLAVAGLVIRSLARHTPPPIVRDALVCLTVVGVYWRILPVRPQLFSILFFTVVLVLLAEADRGRRRALLAVPPVITLWVNVHGGWIVGLATFGVWTSFALVEAGRTGRERLSTAAIGVAAAAVTLLNPYGVGIWTFVWETVGFDRPDIRDWQSLDALSPALILPWVTTLVVGTTAIVRSGWPRHPSHVAIVVLLAIGSFRVSRLDAFFALSIAILLAPQIATVWPRLRPAATIPPGRLESALAIVLVLASCVLVPATLTRAYRNVGCIAMSPDWLPEPEAARFVQTNRLQGRMLTWFDWGEYAIWQFAPAVRVSMDGRRETVYTEATIQRHLRFYRDEPDARGYARALGADYVWLPRGLPVVRTLARQGWIPIFEGPVSTILAASATERLLLPSATRRGGPRCFPGP